MFKVLEIGPLQNNLGKGQSEPRFVRRDISNAD
jgi:hypothetical protein